MKKHVSAQRLDSGDSGGSSWLPGCLIVVAIVFFIFAAGIVVAIVNAKSIAAGIARMVTVEVVNEVGLEPEQKEPLLLEVDRLGEALKNGEISFPEFGQLIGTLVDGPVGSAGAVSLAESAYIEPSGLDEAERATARVVLNQLARGLLDRRIKREALDPILEPFQEGASNNGNFRIKPSLTDAELRSLLTQVQELVDEAGISPGIQPIDYAAEIRRLVEESLGRPLAEPASAETP